MDRPIGPNYLLIATHAHARGATLVTANVGESARVRVLAWKTCSPDIRAFRISKQAHKRHRDPNRFD